MQMSRNLQFTAACTCNPFPNQHLVAFHHMCSIILIRLLNEQLISLLCSGFTFSAYASIDATHRRVQTKSTYEQQKKHLIFHPNHDYDIALSLDISNVITVYHHNYSEFTLALWFHDHSCLLSFVNNYWMEVADQKTKEL